MSSYSNPKLTIVIPTYNEAENIKVLVERLVDVLESNDINDFEVLVVDDNSPDGTCSIVKQISSRDQRIKCVLRVDEKGLASAVVEGFRHAKGSYIVVMDADLQHPPEIVPKLVRVLEEKGADLAVASRYVKGGGVAGWSRIRLLMSRLGTIGVKLLVDETCKTTDPLAGFFAVRKDKLSIEKFRPRGFKILIEILVQHPDLRVVDVPYVFQRRYAGQSKLGADVILDFLKQAWRFYPSFRVNISGLLGVFLYFIAVLYLTGIGRSLLGSLYVGAFMGFTGSLMAGVFLLNRVPPKDKLAWQVVGGIISAILSPIISYALYVYLGIPLVSCIFLSVFLIFISRKIVAGRNPTLLESVRHLS
ncbi:MAG: polyprenol monophosphomannose synthase [Desulfurococcales archaeon]|nr:polyprenol monophosphomannose synthase [Desulfurococcales archaeon]